mmetsp:Transcript_2800/g.7847  ORF Transcript_2800/g.7847 Transcript_2800/m.7847 type:complete len:395 (-) Transcript_2800:129-1313(-)|eukprot:CAMPEP_0168719512 /NCGR_PEP_ID=MMETSP0724-20121128/1075_1 /TAXON_ID=265536 /ORGANISM="Amphiprora sp., Strain CCMP467" /LENGTH=394 /DNA_ID=CAMNT_0008766065 /DNA_START=162 /DNA_END=1346 /DNA_ORIENTATION=-
MATFRYTRQLASFIKRPNVRSRRHPSYFSTQVATTSSSSSRHVEITADPGDFVQGGTRERFQTDPEFAEYMKYNFPEHFDPEWDPNAKSDVEQLPDFMWAEEKNPPKPRTSMSKEERDALDNAPLNMRPLKAYLRSPSMERKKYSTKWMRKQEAHIRYIPGVFTTSGHADTQHLPATWQPYHNPRHLLVKTPWPVLQREFDRYLDRVDSARVYNLSLYEKTPPPPPKWYKTEEMEEYNARLEAHYNHQEPLYQGLVVPKNINWHPVKSIDCFCINYTPYHPGRTMLQLGVEYINQEDSPALRSDSCFPITVQRKINVVVEEGVSIPNAIEVDCTGLNVKDVIRRDRLVLPDGVRLDKSVLKRESKNYVVGVVVGSRRYLLEEKDAGAAAEAEAE